MLANLLQTQQHLLEQSKTNPKYLLQHVTITTNRILLLQQSERWRSSKKEILLAISSLQQYSRSIHNGQDNTANSNDPIILQYHLKLQYLHSLTLQHLKGKNKGPKHAIKTLEKCLEDIAQAQTRDMYIDLELHNGITETLQHLISQQSNTSTPPTETKTKTITQTKTTISKSVPIATKTTTATTTTTPSLLPTNSNSKPTTTTLATSIPSIPTTPTPTPNNLDQILRVGYMYVNTGKLKEAVEVFNQILKQEKSNLGALLGRGSAWALSASSVTNTKSDGSSEELQNIAIELYNKAVEDFTTAIHYHGSNYDTWKRRGQVHAALGGNMHNGLAILDLDRAIELSKKLDSDSLQQRGQIHHRLKNYTLAVQDIQDALTLHTHQFEDEDQKNKNENKTINESKKNNSKMLQLKKSRGMLWNACGLSLNAMGENEAAISCYKKALECTNYTMVEAYTNLGQ